ncbi:Hsp20/alpha crystallin family protein [Candidatus Micrarchaeota archaeon]|nr:Hsp20/alpha crystallin family protein [Candidatus Micrarchaeota archaeon]
MKKRSPFDDDIFSALFGDMNDFFPESTINRFKRMLEEMDMLDDIGEARAPKMEEMDVEISWTGPDGKLHTSHFSNVGRPGKGKLAEEREQPLVDVMNEKEEIRIVAELPGVEKNNIKLTITDSTLNLSVDDPQRKFAKTIKLPAKVLGEYAKATYKNGILEVILKKKEPEKEEKKSGKEIKVG